MPVREVMKDGKKYFQWGTRGKLYTKRSDAERQGRAAYAAGYTGGYQKKG